MTEAYYMQKVACAGGCLRDIIGGARPASQEFTTEEVSEFLDAVRAHGWVEKGGDWYCGEVCPGSPFSPNRLREDFSLTPEQRERLKKLKSINPDYYGTVTIENLEP